MRIPLDYYRILGLPIQATNEQLRQAHRDRTLQLPRREYSDAAIAARKQLLDQAYEVLSDPVQRQRYDASFLAKTYELSETDGPGGTVNSATAAEPLAIDPHTPSIEIEEDQFIGALLILQELGEYELVLKLGRPFLTGGSDSLQDRRYGDPAIVFSDIVLTVALACLELGREQWQQNQYENAAEALETGQQLLLREGLFVGVRGEIQSDLYRLRPYRILELLSVADNRVQERQLGMELLEDMLRERGGIDGNENDQSGLNIDDFLRFIQQLRSYLTAEEQQYLFEQEANRPSAVATYLAVYAQMARGFAERQPQLIYRAKQYLARLSDRQDVHLERAICSLLLGQTEDASRSLEASQEHELITFIRQHSQESPDLLPGLCLYTERWFNDEVFSHFRDFSQYRASLKEYFADRYVQTYLEDLPTETEALSGVGQVRNLRETPVGAGVSATARSSGDREQLESLVSGRDGYADREQSADHDSLIAVAKARIASRSGIATIGSESRFSGGVSTAERVVLEDSSEEDQEPLVPSDRPPSRGRNRGERPTGGVARPSEPRSISRTGGNRPPRSSRFSSAPPWLLPAGILLGFVLLGLLVSWVIRSLQSPTQTTAPEGDEKPLVQLDKPLVELPEAATTGTTAGAIAVLDKSSAEQIINSWLAAKAKAMGSTHDIAALDGILVDPKLSEWRSASEEAKRDGWYRTYKHEVQVESLELLSSATGQVIPDGTAIARPATTTAESPVPGLTTASPSPLPSVPTAASPSPQATGTAASPSPSAEQATADQARVLANVSETTETYRDGKLEGAAQTEALRVQYTLIRKDGKWRIQDWQIQ